MANPQPGIFKEGTSHQHFLEYAFNDGVDVTDIKAAILNARNAANESACAMVIAFGTMAWERLRSGPKPGGMRNLEAINGPNHMAPATPRDVLIWVHGDTVSDVLDLAMAVHHAFAEFAVAELDLPGFVYHDSRDLTGFVDGSANPKEDARMDAALVPNGHAGEGGAFVLTQRWVHDLPSFGTLSQHDQEQVIGRTKPDSIELEGDAMPPWSHVSRTDVKIDGVAQKIYRRSAPYGTPTEHGLYFIAFACDLGRFQVQLDRMFGLTDDGQYDHLMDYSRAVTGAYWFAPSEEMLNAL